MEKLHGIHIYDRKHPCLYINPSIAGLGDIKKDKNSLARQMGLGGYYMVLGVSNTIDDSGWRTNISAVWQSAPPLQG